MVRNHARVPIGLPASLGQQGTYIQDKEKKIKLLLFFLSLLSGCPLEAPGVTAWLLRTLERTTGTGTKETTPPPRKVLHMQVWEPQGPGVPAATPTWAPTWACPLCGSAIWGDIIGVKTCLSTGLTRSGVKIVDVIPFFLHLSL